MVNKKEKQKQALYGDDVREKLIEFAERGWDSIPEDEKDEWFTRFKFWGVFHHRSGQESYFMMRLANVNGQLNAEQLRAIGEVAEEYATGPVENPEFGNGWIDLTTRQSIQLHWLKLEHVPEIWEKLEPLGVTSRSAGGDTMRNITGCPVAGRDKHEFVNSQPILDHIQNELRDDDAFANMPRKYNISVTGCRQGCAQDSINGIGLEPAEKKIDGRTVRGFNVVVGGGLGGREAREARPLDVFVRPERGYDVVKAFTQLYYDEGNRENRQKNRTRFFVDEWGTDLIRDKLQDEYVDFELKRAGTDLREEYTYNSGGPNETDHVGVHEQQDGRNYVGLSVPIGRLPAEDAIAIADLAAEHGSGEIRLTRRQNPIILDVPDEDLDDLLAAPVLDRHTPEPNPFERGTMACTGTEFCSIALAETKTRTARMLRWLRDNASVPDDVDKIKIHFSGCTADCGQAMTADIGLQGMRARKDGEMVEALDIGVGGGVGEDPSFVDFVQQRVPADEVPGAIANLLEAFGEERRAGETFREWCDRTDEEALAEFATPEETSYEDPCLTDAKQSWYPFAEGESPAPTRVDGTPIPSDD